jgi:hypothetical protein
VMLPLLLVVCSGILLQVKKQVVWVQPPTQRGVASRPEISFERILEAVRAVPEAGVHGWGDVERLDVQVARGMVKVQCASRWEVQVDTRTAEVLQVAYRRSDLIEQLHDGSFFGQTVKMWVFLPSGVILLGLWLTGVYLWGLPLVARRRGRSRRARVSGANERVSR